MQFKTILFITLITFACFAQTDIFDKAPNMFRGHFKFMAYEDTSGKGNFIWAGQWYTGEFNFNTIKNNKLVVHWNFVEITQNIKDQIVLKPWYMNNYNYENIEGIRNIKIDEDIISFDLITKFDKVDEELHFYYNRKSKSISGSGIRYSELTASNERVKVEFRQIEQIKLPSNIIR